MGRANKSGKNFRRFWPAVLLPQKAIKNGSKTNPSKSCYLVRYSKMKRASNQTTTRLQLQQVWVLPNAKARASYALYLRRECVRYLHYFPSSVNWAIGCLKWIVAAAFLLLLLLLPPESSFRHVALDSQYHVQECGSNGVANDNIPRVASRSNNYQPPIPSDLWGSWKPTLGGCLPACRAGLMLFWVLDSIIVPN